MTGYYRRFVAGYGEISWSLTQKLKKDAFGWTVEAEAAFRWLKRAMSSVPMFTLPDFSKRFVIEANASGYGVGGNPNAKPAAQSLFQPGLIH